MKDSPLHNSGITEMLFVRLRCEITGFVQQSRKTDARQVRDEAIAELSRRLEQDYLVNCDPSVPLHVMSTLMARSTLLKLEMSSRQPNFIISGVGVTQADKDKFFEVS
jgi:hypothetical protein